MVATTVVTLILPRYWSSIARQAISISATLVEGSLEGEGVYIYIELPRVATLLLPIRIRNVLLDSEQLFAVSAPPLCKMIATNFARCSRKIPVATKTHRLLC